MSASAPGTFVPSIFQFESKQLRIIVKDGEPWFIAADVCAILELGNPSMALRALDEDEKALSSIEGLSRGNDQANIINESGLYTLILRSRNAVKPGSIPHRFRKKVTAEILPTIRKTGKYEAGPTHPPSDPPLAPINLYDGIQKMFMLAMRCRMLLPTPDYVLIKRIDPDIRNIIRNGLYADDDASTIHLLTLSAAELIKATGAPA